MHPSVNKAPTKPTFTSSACTYKALANPKGRGKGKAEKDQTSILEKDFIQKVETIYQQIREREREKARERENWLLLTGKPNHGALPLMTGLVESIYHRLGLVPRYF